ncbi:MAG: TetR/AcrR family transcriptional regulator [Sporomusaceae bacterium]|nr:TetR/AcrR family transcriptional regulator [Sporomusaceae bacterium]
MAEQAAIDPTAVDMRTKREQILDAAYTVFSQKGYHRATVDEIIALADTGKGTVYNYFHNKEQLFYTLVTERSRPFEEAAKKIVESARDPLEKIKILIRLYLEFYVKNADLWRVFMHEMRGFSSSVSLSEKQCDKYRECFKATISLLEKVLEEGIEKKAFRTCQADRTAYCLFSVILTMVFQKFAADGPDSLEQSACMIADTFFYGIVNRETN